MVAFGDPLAEKCSRIPKDGGHSLCGRNRSVWLAWGCSPGWSHSMLSPLPECSFPVTGMRRKLGAPRCAIAWSCWQTSVLSQLFCRGFRDIEGSDLIVVQNRLNRCLANVQNLTKFPYCNVRLFVYQRLSHPRISFACSRNWMPGTWCVICAAVSFHKLENPIVVLSRKWHHCRTLIWGVENIYAFRVLLPQEPSCLALAAAIGLKNLKLGNENKRTKFTFITGRFG